MLSNTDRIATNERGYGIQIGYILSGSSFPEQDARIVVETLRRGGNVPAIAFDGQFHRILACSSQGKPLTIFQLQKQCWEAVKNMSMSEIVIYIENIIKSFHKHTVTILTSPTVIQVSCPDISSSNLRCDKFIFNSAPVCDNIVELQNDDECTGEESSEFVGDNFTNAALDLVLPDVSNQPSNDVDDAIIDELNENDVSSNSICNHISLTLVCVYSLHVFLHENSNCSL